jgi:hypothetical protein
MIGLLVSYKNIDLIWKDRNARIFYRKNIMMIKQQV